MMNSILVLFLLIGVAFAFRPLISSRVRSSSSSLSMDYERVPQSVGLPVALADQISQALECGWLQDQKSGSPSTSRSLLIDLKESADKYEIAIDVPGVKKEDITLDVKDRMLRISMTKEGMTKEETDSFRRIERFHGHMSRIVSLPDNVDAGAVDATITNGVLHVTIPKKEGEKEKKIEIK